MVNGLKRKRIRFKLLIIAIVFFAFLLRIYQITQVPPGLYSDEVSIGYNAYSILKTGRDEHGAFLPLWFRAFGEYKLPIYIYTVAISEFFLGKSDLAVRLPSLLAGVGSIVVFILLLFNLTESKKQALLGGLLLSLSPWHLQFSRAAFEANLALFWVLVGTYLFLIGIKKNVYLLFLGAFFFLMSLYTYNIERVFSPLFFLSLVCLYWYEIKRKMAKTSFWLAIFILLILSIPFLVFSFSPEGLIRAGSESFVQEVKITADDFFRNLIFLRFHQFLKNYLSYFSFDFLFFSGDQMGRHSVREMGMNYLWQLPFFVTGLVTAIKKKMGKTEKLFFLWLILTPLGAAAVKPNPHALRGLILVIPLTFFIVKGILQMIGYFYQRQLLTKIILCGLVSYFILLYLHIYYVHYPKRTAADWSSGYKELVEYVSFHQNQYQKILLTEKLVPDYIYLLFYGEKSLIDKYIFIKSPYVVRLENKTLYVSPFWEKRDEKLLKTISNVNREEIFKIWAN